MKIGGIHFGEMLVPQCLFGLHLASLLRTRKRDSLGELKFSSSQPTFFLVGPKRGDSNTARQDSPPWEGLGEASPCLVESEKTALIMSILCPGRVWLATGGKQNFKEQMVAPLAGMEVLLFPDADALADWYTRAMQLNRTLGTRLHIPTWYYDLMKHPEAKAAGWDLADVIISRGEFSPPYLHQCFMASRQLRRSPHTTLRNLQGYPLWGT